MPDSRESQPSKQRPLPGANVAELLARHVPGLRLFVRAHMNARLRRFEQSDDLVQSVCREVLQHDGGFEYRSEQEFRAWLWVSALNKLRDRVRCATAEKRDPGREVDAEVLETLPIGAKTPSEVAMVREQMGLLEAAFLQLPPDYREVITLSHLQGLPHAAIGARMGRTESAARNLLARALARLGTLLIVGEANGNPDAPG